MTTSSICLSLPTRAHTHPENKNKKVKSLVYCFVKLRYGCNVLTKRYPTLAIEFPRRGNGWVGRKQRIVMCNGGRFILKIRKSKTDTLEILALVNGSLVKCIGVVRLAFG